MREESVLRTSRSCLVLRSSILVLLLQSVVYSRGSSRRSSRPRGCQATGPCVHRPELESSLLDQGDTKHVSRSPPIPRLSHSGKNTDCRCHSSCGNDCRPTEMSACCLVVSLLRELLTEPNCGKMGFMCHAYTDAWPGGGIERDRVIRSLLVPMTID